MGNRDDLLAGARRCLLEKGYAASTIRDIAGAAGVSMAAIGYHFGSREALLTRALDDLMDEWGRSVGASLDGGGDYRDMWARMIGSFPADRALFVASVEAAVLAAHSDEVRAHLARSLAEGRAGMAQAVLGEHDPADPETARVVGAVQLALVSGVLLQQLTDPDGAPTADDVVAGLRALARVTAGR